MAAPQLRPSAGVALLCQNASPIGTSHYQQGPLHLERAQFIDGRQMQRRIAACAAGRVAMATVNSGSDDAALPRAQECGADGRQLPPSGRCAQPEHRPAFGTRRVKQKDASHFFPQQPRTNH